MFFILVLLLMSAMDVEGDLLTIDQAASYIGTKPRFIRRLVDERRIAFHRLGRFIRLRRSDLDEFVAAGRVEPPERATPSPTRQQRETK